MRRCFLKHSETASKRLKIGAILLCNRLQDVMGLWWCVCVAAFMVLFCFLLFFLTLRPSKWSDGIISWQSWPWTNESILKKVTLGCQEVRNHNGCGWSFLLLNRVRMQMPWASYAYFTSNGAQWSHQSNHCSPFCPYFVHLPWQSSGLRIA